jgi:hypothetical protein
MKPVWKTKQKSTLVRTFFISMIFSVLVRIAFFSSIYHYVLNEFEWVRAHAKTYKNLLMFLLDFPKSFVYISLWLLYCIYVVAGCESRFKVTPKKYSITLKMKIGHARQ